VLSFIEFGCAISFHVSCTNPELVLTLLCLRGVWGSGTSLLLWVFDTALKLAALSGSELCCFLEVSHLVADTSYRNLKLDRIAVDRGEVGSQLKHPGK